MRRSESTSMKNVEEIKYLVSNNENDTQK